MGVRAVIEPLDNGFGIALGPAWRRGYGIGAGDTVTVELAPEGPQRGELPEDLRAALDTNPEAAAFWNSLAQFYRRAYLRWIDATKRGPDQRPVRIAEVIALLRDESWRPPWQRESLDRDPRDARLPDWLPRDWRRVAQAADSGDEAPDSGAVVDVARTVESS